MDTTTPVDRIDPNVTIPAAVKAAVARSEELIKKINAPENAPEAPTEEASSDTKMSSGPETVQPEKEPQREVKPAPTEDSWEHRYNSMKGRFERAQSDNQRLASEVANLHRLLSEMQASQSVQSSADTKFERLVTPEEENDYGSEFLGVVGKKAKEELTPEIKSLQNQIKQLEGRLQGVTGVVVQDARQKMYQVLDEQVVNWRDLNSNPDFLNWLNLPDAYSGAIRKELLNAAYQRNDAARVAAFFKGFISDEAATNPATHVERQVSSEANKRPSLESFAAPGRAKTAAAASAPVEKPIFTRAQITEFYSDVRRGKYAGKDSEKDRIERDIFAAQREGRIR